jgi:hypothetical protein
MGKFRSAIDCDPQFNQSDPFDGSLKAWRQAACVALSTTNEEPRHVVAARAAAEQSARQAAAEGKRLRAMETNLVAMGRAVDRFGTDQLKPAAPVISSPAITAPKQAPALAAEKELPTWLNRMFGRKAESRPSARHKLSSGQLPTKQVAPAPHAQKPVQPPPSPGRRSRARDDDRGRD